MYLLSYISDLVHDVEAIHGPFYLLTASANLFQNMSDARETVIYKNMSDVRGTANCRGFMGITHIQKQCQKLLAVQEVKRSIHIMH